ncbi:MAG: hypothetical protein LRZ99_03245 [Desulfotomaculum sp.]|nr:hypothetical protein [Desulfotomaculum sp.]
MLSKKAKYSLLLTGGVAFAASVLLDVSETWKIILFGITIITVVLVLIKSGGC